MAKIVATFDTSDKSLIVDMDGKKFKNVSDVSFFQSFSDDGKFFAQVNTVEQSEDSGVTVVTRTMAKDGTITTKSNIHSSKTNKDKDKDKDKDKKKSNAEELGELLFNRAH